MLSAISYLPRPLVRLVMDTAKVPRDLSEVTSYDPSEEVDPESVGMTQKGVDKIWKSIEGMYATGMQPAITFVLRRHGQIVLKRAIGHARGNGPGDAADERPVPMTPETPICLFSTSKALAAVCLHLLSERKQVSLLDPVSHYIPEFGQNGKRGISIYQLLCHKAGIPTVAGHGDGVDFGDLLTRHDEILEGIYAAEPEKPGHHHSYHALTAGFVIADLVERVTGQKFRRFFRENITQPLGFRYMDFGATKAVQRKMARHYLTGTKFNGFANIYATRAIGTTLQHAVELSNDERFYKAVIPAGNGVATADECGRFFQCLLDGGQLNGTRIIDPLTVRRATVEVGKPEIDRSLLVPIRYSAGMMLGGAKLSLYGPDTTKAFGHLGFTNNFGWADPERDISAAFLTTGKSILGLHTPFLVAMLSNISKHCPKLSERRQKDRMLAIGMA